MAMARHRLWFLLEQQEYLKISIFKSMFYMQLIKCVTESEQTILYGSGLWTFLLCMILYKTHYDIYNLSTKRLAD